MCSRCFYFLFILNGIKVQWECAALPNCLPSDCLHGMLMLMQSHDIYEDGNVHITQGSPVS